VLVLGCSTGNGLERVDPKVTSRVAVVDLNPAYLRRLGERFPDPGFELDIRCADLADVVLEREAFDLVHAGLVLEYVDWRLLLPRVATTLKSRAVLNVVLQLHPPRLWRSRQLNSSACGRWSRCFALSTRGRSLRRHMARGSR